MYSKYTIGEISKLLGISPQTIRYYEKKKIIEPIYLEEKKYRQYTTWDFHILMRARYYRGLGFSLQETAQMLSSEANEKVKENLIKQEKKIEEEIKFKLQLLNQIRKNYELMDNYRDVEEKFSFKMRPGIYRINTQEGYSLLECEELRKMVGKWAEKAPFLFSTAVFPKESIERGEDKFYFGLGLEEKFIDYLKFKLNTHVEYYPPTLCIHTCVQSRSGKILTYKILDGVLKYIKENGFEISGDITTQIFFMSKKEESNEYFSWHEVWVPIK